MTATQGPRMSAKVTAERRAQAAEQKKEERNSIFRKNIAAGDESSDGLVIEIKGKLAKIQTLQAQCTQRDGSGSCKNWIDTHVEKWLKIADLQAK